MGEGKTNAFPDYKINKKNNNTVEYSEKIINFALQIENKHKTLEYEKTFTIIRNDFRRRCSSGADT